MKLFNSFQATLMFVAWPFLISWLGDQNFRGASVAYTAACFAYFVGFCCITGCVYYTMSEFNQSK